jgi:hypothetical protein
MRDTKYALSTPSTLDVLHYFARGILDLCFYFLDVLLGLTLERLVTLGMFCSLSSGGWKLSSHLSMRSGCDKVHEACCSAIPFEKGITLVLSATLWITDSTTVQNLVIIAIVSKLQHKSSYKISNLTINSRKHSGNEPPSSSRAIGRHVGM